jgi:EpsI family protein
LPGSGWEFISFEERGFGELAAGTSGTFKRVIVQKGDFKMLMYYWFQQRERQTANEFGMKYYVVVDRLKSGRTDGALVRLSTAIATGGQGLAEAEQRLRGFAEAALPKMKSYLPK